MVCGQKIAQAGSTVGEQSASPSPTLRWRSSSTTRKSASCAAPLPRQSVPSKPVGRGRLPQFPRVRVKHHLARNRPASPGTRQREVPGRHQGGTREAPGQLGRGAVQSAVVISGRLASVSRLRKVGPRCNPLAVRPGVAGLAPRGALQFVNGRQRVNDLGTRHAVA